VAIANASQLEAGRATPTLSRFIQRVRIARNADRCTS